MPQILKGLSLLVAVMGIFLAPIALLSIWFPLFGLLSTAALYKLYGTFAVLAALLATLTLSAHVTTSFRQAESGSKTDANGEAA